MLVLENESLNLISWFEENFMKVNPEKFQEICMGKMSVPFLLYLVLFLVINKYVMLLPFKLLCLYASVCMLSTLIFAFPMGALFLIFSAHLNRRLIGELIEYTCTGIWRPSNVQPSTFSNDITYEALRPILSILNIYSIYR